LPLSERGGGRYDAIVAGSGHNGLISAAYLAKAGRQVLVLERREEIGANIGKGTDTSRGPQSSFKTLLLLDYRLFVSVAEPVEDRLVETPPYKLQAHRKS
jgi:flavin-dependent dehydrogenase